MKKIFFIAAFALLMVSCEEFEPMFAKYEAPSGETPYKTYTREEVEKEYGKILTIADVCRLYNEHLSGLTTEQLSDNAHRALHVYTPLVVEGVVSTTDKPGNFYKTFYIQDKDQGGLEIKVGKNGLYNDYKQGQRVFIVLSELSIGMYGFKTGNYGGQGMVQIGFEDPSAQYETSYMENTLLVDTHILRTSPLVLEPDVVAPVEIAAAQLPDAKMATAADSKYVGRVVTLKGMQFADENFVLMYVDSNKDKKQYYNRIFLSDTNGIGKFGKGHNIKTWGLSKERMKAQMLAGDWDDAFIASGSQYLTDEQGNKMTVGDFKGEDGEYAGIEKAAYSVSQYFSFEGKEIQVRTSGFCKFCDFEIPEDILNKSRSIDITGVLTLYQGSYQLTVNSADDFVYSDTKEKIYQ